MYFRQKEHNPPHIHAIYGEYIGVFSLLDCEMFEGDSQRKEQTYVKEFIIKNKRKLLKMWETQEFEMIPSVEQ